MAEPTVTTGTPMTRHTTTAPSRFALMRRAEEQQCARARARLMDDTGSDSPDVTVRNDSERNSSIDVNVWGLMNEALWLARSMDIHRSSRPVAAPRNESRVPPWTKTIQPFSSSHDVVVPIQSPTDTTRDSKEATQSADSDATEDTRVKRKRSP